MNGCASCFLVCKQLWFNGRGGERSRGQHVIFDLFPCTISLSLYISFTWCHAWIAPWPPNPPTTTTTSTTTNTTLLLPPRLPVPPDTMAAAAPENPLFPLVVVTCWWRFGCENSGATAGRGQWVWGTTRKGTWSVGVGTSCKRDVLTATTLS